MSLPTPESLLPHRGQFLLLDTLTRLDDTGAAAVGTWEPSRVEGHFPGMPVVPGVLLLEGLAQTMACLDLHLRTETDGTPMLVGFDKVRFRAAVLPPATVTYEVRLKEVRFGMTTGVGVVRQDGKKMCTALLTGTVVPKVGP